jgi:protein involved in polysaccharide export with SLBB domain
MWSFGKKRLSENMRKHAHILRTPLMMLIIGVCGSGAFGADTAAPAGGAGAAINTQAAITAPAAQPIAGTVALGVGDRIMVRVAIEPKLTGEYTVDERGKFYFPIIDEGLDFGAFDVAGMTTDQATEMIRQRLSQYYADSDITLELVSLGVRPGQAVSVFGYVQTPGTFRYFEGMRLLDLLLRTGTFDEDANISRIALYRANKQIEYIDVRDVVSGTDLANNIEIMPGDYFIVPKKEPLMKMKVIVLGSVGQPGTIFVPEGIQLLDLIARAGGTSGKAALGKTYIIRIVDGQPVIIHSDLKALIDRAELKENVVVKDGDIVFIPASSRVSISQIMNSLLQLNLVRSVLDPGWNTR